MALACVRSTGLIPANAVQVLLIQCYITTWKCCQVKLLGAYCSAGGDCYQKGKFCSANKEQCLKPAEGNGNRSSQVAASEYVA